MEPSIFRFIFRYSLKGHLVLLGLTAASLPFFYMTLDLPKQIINDAIGGTEFPRDFLGQTFEQIPFLLLLCFIFLGLVIINGAFKYVINVFTGQLAERELRRLRYILYARVLRFPTSQFRKTGQGEVVSMITGEVEPLGGFIGDSVSLPAFQGGTMLTILVFMFVQNWMLALAAIALFPLQLYLIPKLQRRVNLLAKERVKNVRKLSERIGETIQGIEDIHGHDASEWMRTDVSQRLGVIFKIRYEIYRRKFFIKFLNNFIAQVTPFLFFSIGGWLVISGELTFGALVAALAAYKDLTPPWKELLNYMQRFFDARIKYEQLIEQFQPPGLMSKEQQLTPPEVIDPLTGKIVVSNVGLEEDGVAMLEGVNFDLPLAARTALSGHGGSGRAALSRVLARMVQPTAGRVKIGELGLAGAHEAQIGRRTSFVDQGSYIFAGTVRDNLLLGLKHAPLSVPERGGEERDAWNDFLREAERSGNTQSDPEADWLDLDAAGLADEAALAERLDQVLDVVEIKDNIFEFGLQATPERIDDDDLCLRVLEARKRLRAKLAETEAGKLVETFDRARYNENLSVAENLLMGFPLGDRFHPDRLAENDYVARVLEKVGLTETFVQLGRQVADVMLELFQDLPPSHSYFERYSFISADDLPMYQAALRRAASAEEKGLSPEDGLLFTGLTFKLIRARHRLGLIDGAVEARILEARRVFAEDLSDADRAQIAFFDEEAFNPAASIQDNILFGKLVYGRRQAREEVGRLIAEVVDDQGLRADIMDIGLKMEVGIAGGRLSSAQRIKLALARALIKGPDLLVVNEATAALDMESHRAIMANVFRLMEGKGVIWVIPQAELDDGFDNAVILEAGKVADFGSLDDLKTRGIVA
ncbi:MAG: ABC transporter transmembrane domain-containing protein [Magnetovibrionaceae bacterium]